MKKLIAAFLALCLACSMAACAGGTTSESSTASTSSTSSESSVAEESVASEEPSSSDVSEASSEGSDTAEATVLSHEEYMAAELDTEVTIQAYVQAKQSYYAEQGTATVYLQDQDGAYFAYDMACTQEEYDAMTEGTCIQVTGFKSEWSGEIEIMDGQLDQIVEGDTFVAEPLDATELLGTDELEQHQNEKVSFTGLTVAPGFEDPHVHFRDPGQTYKESMVSGCRASASGGYTNVLIMPNTLPALDGQTVSGPEATGAKEVLDAGFDNVIDFLQQYDTAHDVQLPVRYDLCVCASKDRAGHEASDVADWLKYVPGFEDDAKTPAMLTHPITAISDDGSAVTPEILDQVLENVKASDLYLIEHCEHHDTGAVNEGPVSRELGVPGIPEDTELKIVARDIEAARRTGVHVHFQHVSTAISFEAIRRAKAEGLPITCETAPHYLA